MSHEQAPDTYLSFLSHDLRGNLNGVLLMIEVMRRDIEAADGLEKLREDLDLMRSSLHETIAGMERYLLAERIRRGKTTPAVTQVQLRDVAAEVIQRHARAARDAGVALVNDVPAPVAARADPSLLSTTWSELVSNVLKHAPGSDARLIHESLDGGLAVGVSDSGASGSIDRLNLFLDPARRAQTRERALGLALAKSAAELMGARLEIRAAGPGGTIMMIVLPAG